MAKTIANYLDVPFAITDATALTEAGYVGDDVENVISKLYNASGGDKHLTERGIVFIDEIDAIGSKRLDSTTSGDREVHRTLMQLLSEMDGFTPSEGISVIAATNRMELLDKALLRPGRFDRIIAISSPDRDGVKDILKIHTANVPLARDVEMSKISRLCEGFSGAEIKAAVTEAAMAAISSDQDKVSMENFQEGVERIQNERTKSSKTSPDSLYQ
ncbi:MAG: AAA family ATPase [Euryarchaeota archaeon]|nr:AAA family ATPase [Euryarchaeota archaeon]